MEGTAAGPLAGPARCKNTGAETRSGRDGPFTSEAGQATAEASAGVAPPTTAQKGGAAAPHQSTGHYEDCRFWLELPADASDEEVARLLHWFSEAASPDSPMEGWFEGDVRSGMQDMMTDAPALPTVSSARYYFIDITFIF